MDAKEAAACIRSAQQNNQLVIFVGAGVSKNSGLPTWKELTAEIAGQMDWQQEDGSLSQEAFLRIAEYFYNQNQDAYYALIKKLLSTETAAPNPIDDAIFELFPRHIITTNYDDLLERSNSVNAALYTVITKDSDLISRASEHYLIKMHGDAADPATIVLKESDYTIYEQRHVLISTFVRALLINHTFVFLGYALDDYNLNLILAWINYFSALYHATARPKNFFISTEPVSDFEVLRLKEKNIDVVDLTEMPPEMIREHDIPDALTQPMGRLLYAFLQEILLKSAQPADASAHIIKDTLGAVEQDLLSRQIKSPEQARALCESVITALAPVLSAQTREYLRKRLSCLS